MNEEATLGARPSAYPDEKVSVEAFKYRTPLHLTRDINAVQRRKGEDANYVLSERYKAVAFIEDRRGKKKFDICVPKNFLTDLSSVPWWGRWLVSRVGPHLEASIVHDWLYVAWQHDKRDATEEMRGFADDVFRVAMEEANVKGWRIWLIYQAVHFGGKTAFYGTEDSLFRDAAP